MPRPHVVCHRDGGLAGLRHLRAARMKHAAGRRIERARQLAYLLFEICGRRKWADEAVPYNMLATAWPEVVRLAESSSALGPVAEKLF